MKITQVGLRQRFAAASLGRHTRQLAMRMLHLMHNRAVLRDQQ